MHKSVLTEKVTRFLKIHENGVYADLTGGGGGHSRAILKHLGKHGRLLIVDCDREAVQRLASLFVGEKRCCLVHAKFSNLKSILVEHSIPRLDGFVADFGISSYQLEDANRGFSFQGLGPLDMRLDRCGGDPLSHHLKQWSEEELANVLYYYGEERASRRIAHAIKKTLKENRLNTTEDLRKLMEQVLGFRLHKHKVHPATRVFMALRIAVNEELDELKNLLTSLPDVLSSGGRAAMIAFHSLEDRLVKTRFRELKKEGWALLTPKPVVPAKEEVLENPRSRSAKLRVIERK